MIVAEFLKRLHRREFYLEKELKDSQKIDTFPSEEDGKRHADYIDTLIVQLEQIRTDIEVYVKLHQDKKAS